MGRKPLRQKGLRTLRGTVCEPPVCSKIPLGKHQTLAEQGLGGAEGSRTPDLVIANDALYQLSYGPPIPRVIGLGEGATYEGGSWVSTGDDPSQHKAVYLNRRPR